MTNRACIGCYAQSATRDSLWCPRCFDLWPEPIRHAAAWGLPEELSGIGEAGDIGNAIAPRYFVELPGGQRIKFYSAIIDSELWVRVFLATKRPISVAREQIIYAGESSQD